MPSVALEAALAQLPKVIERLKPGEAMVITRDETPVARLTTAGPLRRNPASLAIARGC